MKLSKSDADFLYDTLGKVCILSIDMLEEDKKKISDSIENIITILKKYEEE